MVRHLSQEQAIEMHADAEYHEAVKRDIRGQLNNALSLIAETYDALHVWVDAAKKDHNEWARRIDVRNRVRRFVNGGTDNDDKSGHIVNVNRNL